MRHGFAVLALVALGATPTPGPAPAPAPPPAPRAASAPVTKLTPTVYAITINGTKVDDGAIILRGSANTLYVRRGDLETWHVQVPTGAATVEYAGETYVALNALALTNVNIDAGKAMMSFSLPTSSFQETVTDARYLSQDTPQRANSAFLNYQLFAEKITSVLSLSSSFEQGLSSKLGVLLNSFGVAMSSGSSSFTRTATTFIHDDVGRMTSIRFGDTTSSADDISRSVNFAGVSMGTDYSLSPSYVWYPGVSIAGSAAVPSTLDLFVNNVAAVSKNVDPGQYQITNIPVIDGAGNVTVMVTDPTGARHYQTIPYYFTRDLLKKGTHEYSASVGFLHTGVDGMGTYGPLVAQYTASYGLTNRLTLGGHAETGGGRSLAGLSLTTVVPKLGEFSESLAESAGALGAGMLEHIAWSYQSMRLRFGAIYESRQDGYRALDSLGPEGNPYAGQTIQVYTGIRVSAGMLAALTYSSINRNSVQPASLSTVYGIPEPVTVAVTQQKFIEASLSQSLPDGAQRSLTLYREIGNGGFGLQLNYQIALGHHRYVTETIGNTAIGSSGTEFSQNLPDSGYGTAYDVQTPFPHHGLTEVDAYHYSPFGNLIFDGQWDDGQTYLGAQAAGGLIFAGGHILPTQTIESSFGVVQVPGQAGIPVYADERLVGYTDRDGYAAIPFLQPYIDNSVRIDSAALPLSVDVTNTQKTVMPYNYNAAYVKYDLVALGGVTLELALPNGKPVPSGSSARVIGSSLTSPVGDDGLVYFSPISPGQTAVEVKMGVDGTCHATFTVPDDTSTQPNLGTVTCE